VKKHNKNYAALENAALPTERQKEKMLEHILAEYRKYSPTPAEKFLKLVAAYPWRFAFAFSTLQAALCTAIWDTGYTNMVLRIFGGLK
jgi:hypothetical protein